MKKVIRYIATVLVVCIVTIGLNFLTEGVPLFGAPGVEEVGRIIIEHSDYPNEVKECIEKDKIELAVALLGYLDYAPLKRVSDDDTPIIQMTYIMNDGTEIIVKANDTTVWWNGKTRATHDEGMFMKMCTAVFYLQE